MVKNKLRELRRERSWSQEQLARTLGVSRQTINAIEAGRHDPSLELALEIGRVFAKSLEAIFSLEGERNLWGV